MKKIISERHEIEAYDEAFTLSAMLTVFNNGVDRNKNYGCRVEITAPRNMPEVELAERLKTLFMEHVQKMDFTPYVHYVRTGELPEGVE